MDEKGVHREQDDIQVSARSASAVEWSWVEGLTIDSSNSIVIPYDFAQE
jgi:hypothetical protein